jgi:hypothetical protein
LEITIAGGMGSQCRLFCKAKLGGFFRADALENSPTLVQGSGRVQNAIDLVASREWAAIQKHDAIPIALQKVGSGSEHDLLAEIIPLGRVFDFVRGKERVPDLVFTKQSPAHAAGQFAGECSLAGAGKASHEDDHDRNEIIRGWLFGAAHETTIRRGCRR